MREKWECSYKSLRLVAEVVVGAVRGVREARIRTFLAGRVFGIALLLLALLALLLDRVVVIIANISRRCGGGQASTRTGCGDTRVVVGWAWGGRGVVGWVTSQQCAIPEGWNGRDLEGFEGGGVVQARKLTLLLTIPLRRLDTAVAAVFCRGWRLIGRRLAGATQRLADDVGPCAHSSGRCEPCSRPVRHGGGVRERAFR